MWALTPRQISLIKMLLSQTKAVTAKGLASEIGVSDRSIRNDLVTVEGWMRERGLSLCRRPRVGFWVDGEPSCVRQALAEVGDQSICNKMVVVGEDRPWLILAWILASREPASVTFLASLLGVSQRTLYYDIKRMRPWVESQGLSIRCQDRRVSVSGDEVRCRETISRFLERYNSSTTLEGLIPLLRGNAVGRDTAQPFVRGYLDKFLASIGGSAAVSKVSGIVAAAQRNFDLRLSASVFSAVVAHILIALARVKEGWKADFDTQRLQRLMSRPEWNAALWIAERLEECFSVSMPLPEVGYVTLYLEDSGRSVVPHTEGSLPEEYLGLFARSICERSGAYLGINLIDDLELRIGLVAHAYGSLEKIRAGIQSRNPLLDQIRSRYPLIHSAARNAAREVGIMLATEIPDEEAGWLALHIGAALERLAKKRRTWRGLVVCASGIGTAQMLKIRLESEFPQAKFETASVMNERDIWVQASQFNADLVISTVPLRESSLPLAVVSPFLTTRDVKKVAESMYIRGVTNETELIAMCRDKTSANDVRVEPSASGVALSELIHPDIIWMKAEAHDAADAIRLAGNVLERNGVCNNRYVEAMVDLYRRLGPYMVVNRGVALPHASPEEGAVKVGVSIVSLREPVCFGAPDNDPVKLVIGFASPDYVSHARALMDLFRVLQSGVVERLIRAGSADEIIALISSTVS